MSIATCVGGVLTDLPDDSPIPIEKGLRDLLAYDGDVEYGIQFLVPGGEVNMIHTRALDGNMAFDVWYQPA